jgi:hypothetical protein
MALAQLFCRYCSKSNWPVLHAVAGLGVGNDAAIYYLVPPDATIPTLRFFVTIYVKRIMTRNV